MPRTQKIAYAISDFPIYGGIFRPRNRPQIIEFESPRVEAEPHDLTLVNSIEIADCVIAKGSQVVSHMVYSLFNKTRKEPGEVMVLRIRDPKNNIHMIVTSRMKIFYGDDIEVKFQGLNAAYTITYQT